MDIDIFESIEERDIDLEMKIGNRLYEQYVDRYVKEIHRLKNIKDFVRDDRVHNINTKYHIMYKLKVGDNGETFIKSKDGKRAYEFLIEFDTKDPEYGIYYGCRALVIDGNQEEEINKLQKEWINIRKELTEVLNNTFINKDFTHRFRMTNNVNNKTFWPFWIALYDDEDITDVAILALKIIYKVYKNAINKSLNGGGR